jgi:hypothetical protein
MRRAVVVLISLPCSLAGNGASQSEEVEESMAPCCRQVLGTFTLPHAHRAVS